MKPVLASQSLGRGDTHMDMKEVMERVRADLREHPHSRFSEVYFRMLEGGARNTDVRTALYEMLKRDEVHVKQGRWRLVAPVEQRRAS